MRRADDDDRLDEVFHALANRTRRALLGQLASGPARVTELAAPHGMSVNAVSKHLFVLERAGLIRRHLDAGAYLVGFDGQATVEQARGLYPAGSLREWHISVPPCEPLARKYCSPPAQLGARAVGGDVRFAT